METLQIYFSNKKEVMAICAQNLENWENDYQDL